MCGKRSVATATHTPLLIVIWLFSDCHITSYLRTYGLYHLPADRVRHLRVASSVYGQSHPPLKSQNNKITK